MTDFPRSPRYVREDVKVFPETVLMLQRIGPKGERPIERLKRETARIIQKRLLKKEA